MLTAKKTYSPEDKAAYRAHKSTLAYDRAVSARSIIQRAYHQAHPNSRRDPRDGICSCGSPIKHGEINVYLDERGHEYHNHKSCKSWACPICAPKRAAARADEIESALLAANEKGYTCLFLTFTVPHRKSHSSAFVIERLNNCYNKFLQSRRMRSIKSEYGYVGAIKCLDYTLTDNGTHAHLHTIFVFDTPLDAFDLVQYIGADFVKMWDRVVFNESGQHISKRHGFNVELIELGDPDDPDVARIAKYSAKAISTYCSDGDKDKGSRYPFDLLNSTATPEDEALYLDFYKGQKGRRHIFFSRGLRAVLNIENVEAAPKKTAAIITNIQYEHAYFLRDERRRLEFESRLADSVSAALEWLNRESRIQQYDLARRYGDSMYRDMDPCLAVYADVVSDLDAEGADRPSVLSVYSAIQDDFLPSIARDDELREIARLDRVYDHLERRRAAASARARSGVSGLGAALAEADDHAPCPARDSLFYPSPSTKKTASSPLPSPESSFVPAVGSVLAGCWSDDDDFGF